MLLCQNLVHRITERRVPFVLFRMSLHSIELIHSGDDLWADAEPCVSRDNIDFDSIKRGKYSIGAYALLCAAKDVYRGTGSMNIADMSDRSVIPDAVFGIICNVMMIKINLPPKGGRLGLLS